MFDFALMLWGAHQTRGHPKAVMQGTFLIAGLHDRIEHSLSRIAPDGGASEPRAKPARTRRPPKKTKKASGKAKTSSKKPKKKKKKAAKPAKRKKRSKRAD